MQMAQQEGGAITGVQPAGFWERFVAYLIDSIIIGVANTMVALFLPNLAVTLLVEVAISVGYVVYFWTSSGQTPGKMVMGLKVVDAETGELITPGAAVLRWVGYIISGIVVLLGFLWVIWDPKKQAWHDKIAKTLVVKSS